jgi:hypothetical protein
MPTLNNTLERKLIKQRIVPSTMIEWLDRHGKLSNKVLTVKILREECDISLFAAKIAVERWMELRVGKHDDSGDDYDTSLYAESDDGSLYPEW